MAGTIVIPLNTGGVITQALPATFDPSGDTVRLYILPNRYAAETTYISGTISGTLGSASVTFVVPASQTTVAGVKWARARIYPASGDPLQLFSRKLIVTTNEVTSSTAVASSSAGPAGAGGDVVKIATVAVGAGGAATIDFSAIPATYRNLRLQLTGRLATGAGGFAVCSLTYNGSTAAAYDVNFVKNASGTITGGNSAGNVGHDFNMTDPGATALLPATLDLILFDYARTAWYKLSRAENGLFYNAFSSSLNVTSWQVWRNTAAVNRITLTPPANFAQDTVATLYGITG